MYLVNTQPDICYDVNQLSQAMVKPTKLFWKAGKHVLRYLRGTSGYGLWYRHSDEVKMHGIMDVDWAGSPTERKSTSGGIFSIGLTTFSWYNRKQRSVALSGGRVHGSKFGCMRGYMDEEDPGRFVRFSFRSHGDIL